MLFNNSFKIGLCFVLLIHQSAASFSQSLVPGAKPFRYAVITSIQEEPDLEIRPKNNIFLNILGDGSVASLNYERLFFINHKHCFITTGVGMGVNFFVKIHSNNGTTYSAEQYIIIPHHITLNIGTGRHFLEVGGGGAILSGPRTQPYLPYVTAGYRIQPWNSHRVNFRIFGSYPLESLEKFEIVYIPVGVSLGWTF